MHSSHIGVYILCPDRVALRGRVTFLSDIKL